MNKISFTLYIPTLCPDVQLPVMHDVIFKQIDLIFQGSEMWNKSCGPSLLFKQCLHIPSLRYLPFHPAVGAQLTAGMCFCNRLLVEQL